MTADEYVENVRIFLQNKHGEVKQSWEGLLEMLRTEYFMFLTAREEIFSQGMTVTTSKGLVANPAIKIMQDAAIQVQKIVNDLGVNPKMLSKVKPEEKEEDSFLENLING